MKHHHAIFDALVVVAACGVTRPSLAQTPDPTAAPPASQPATPPSSLDDLLDIDKDKPAEDQSTDAPPAETGDAAAAAAEEAKRELDKQLSEAEIANAFVQAVEKMSVAADLLDAKFDPGLGTQRVQEDIIAKLAQLLDQAKKNKSNSSSSSSSSSQQQQQQQQQKKQDPGKRNNQQQQKDNPSDQRNQNPSDNRSEAESPAPKDADPNAILEETRSEWGNLPQRVRDMLLQGRKDKFSTLYERMTEEYYKRLAEEGSP